MGARAGTMTDAAASKQNKVKPWIGLTYSDTLLACAAAVATIEAMENKGIVENAQRIGDQVLRPGLEEQGRSTRSSATYAGWGCSSPSNW